MAVGFQAYTDSGTIQFDSEAPAFAFVGKGTVKTGDLSDGASNPYSSWAIAQAENLPTFDTFALSCSTGAVTGGSINVGDSNSLLVSTSGGSHVVTYYLFRSYSKLPSIAGAGFECFTSNGQLAYSTAYRPLTIIAKHPVTNQRLNMSDSRVLPDGRQYAFIAYGNNQRDMGNGGGGGGGVDISFQFNGATIGARLVNGGYVVEELRGNSIYWGNPNNGGFLVADVTGC